MARRLFWQEAGEQSAKTTRVFNGPKATAGEMPTRYHRPITTRSQSPLSRTPPRNPLGTPTKPPPPAHQTSPARSRHFPNCPTRTLSPATKVSAEERGWRRKTYQGRQELLIKGHLGLTHCLNRGLNGGNVAANCCKLGDGGFIILEVGRSQSFLPLWKGPFAGITARENTKLGRSPNDSAPEGLLAEDRDRLSQLALGTK
jgi:hypothetical protein